MDNPLPIWDSPEEGTAPTSAQPQSGHRACAGASGDSDPGQIVAAGGLIRGVKPEDMQSWDFPRSVPCSPVPGTYKLLSEQPLENSP